MCFTILSLLRLKGWWYAKLQGLRAIMADDLRNRKMPVHLAQTFQGGFTVECLLSSELAMTLSAGLRVL